MRIRKKILWADITTSGDLSYYKGELEEFLKMYRGRKVKIVIDLLPQEQSERLINYYYGYVVPTMARAIYESGERLTEEQAEERIRRISPIMWQEYWEGGKHKGILRDVGSLDNAELIEHIDFLKQYGAENYGVYIDDPQDV